MNNMEQVDFIENQLCLLIKTFGFKNVAVGLHNSLCHGRALLESDYALDDDDLIIGACVQAADDLIKIANTLPARI